MVYKDCKLHLFDLNIDTGISFLTMRSCEIVLTFYADVLKPCSVNLTKAFQEQKKHYKVIIAMYSDISFIVDISLFTILINTIKFISLLHYCFDSKENHDIHIYRHMLVFHVQNK